jgi:hypothetical protein
MSNDSLLPDPSPTTSDTRTSLAPENSTSSSGRIGKNGAARSVRRVHAVLSGKGGIGKTFIASLIAQAIQKQGESPLCFDADPVNASLHEISALKAEPVNLYMEDDDEIDVGALDEMMARVLAAQTMVVIDNGAPGFVPFARYLIRNKIVERLERSGKRLVIHTIVAGGSEFEQTVRGFNSIASQFPASAPLVLWLNPHNGNIGGSAAFAETPVFKRHQDRISAVIELPRLDRYYQYTLKKMTDEHLTFAEAMADGSGFNVMDQSRLFDIWEPLSEQIAAVL